MQAITGTTKLLGVIGYPIEQSLSPVMHNAAISALAQANSSGTKEFDYIYLPFSVKPENLAAAIAGFAAMGVIGFSVTIPHKQAIRQFLSEESAIAQTVGAVNTVWRTEKGWSGTNTDIEGFLAPLRQQNRDWSQTKAVILGNGGAARAVVVGCAQLGCKEIHVVGRNRQNLNQFLDSWADASLSLPLTVHLWQEIPNLIPYANLLVNASPIGMYPHGNESPIDLTAMELPPEAIAYDLIYKPNPTLFLQQAQAQGAMIIDGLEMLVQQGAAALQIWLQQTPPVEIMRQSLKQHLGL